MDAYFFVKWLHIVGAAVLFGTGLGTAWYMWAAHRTGEPAVIAAVGRMVVRADWLFTGVSGIAQPLTGALLIHLGGHSPSDPWLLAAIGLYVLAFACWAPVVQLQIRAQKLAARAVADKAPLGDDYHAVMRRWFWLGWPAFLALLAVFALMIARPDWG